MSFVDKFLKPAKKGAARPPESAVGDLEQALAKIQQERAANDAMILAHSEKRRELLLENAPTAEILAHDIDADRAHIEIQRLAAAANEIQTRLEIGQAAIEDARFRQFYDNWRAAALKLVEAIHAARQANHEFLALHGATIPPAWERALRLDRCPMINPGSLPANLHQIHEKEMRRREGMDRVFAEARARGMA